MRLEMHCNTPGAYSYQRTDLHVGNGAGQLVYPSFLKHDFSGDHSGILET